MKHLITALLLVVAMPCLASADSAADADAIPFEEFSRIVEERKVSFDADTVAIILKFVDDLDPVPSEIAGVAERLRDKNVSISFKALLPLVTYKDSQAVCAKLGNHKDPLLRFIANGVLAGSGDSKAAEAVHGLIHNQSLSTIDKRLLKTWCDGVGIRATRDNAAAIVDHLSTAMGGKPKFKKGDLAPSFEIETTKGHKLSSRELKGKVIVLHFWSTTCGPCIEQMSSHIKSLSEHDSKSVEIVFVSLDNDKEAFDSTVAKFAIPFHSIRESLGWGGHVARAFGVNSMPFDIVIDKDGRIFSNSIVDIDAALIAASTPLPQDGRTKP